MAELQDGRSDNVPVRIKKHHDAAFFKIFKALQLDEAGELPEALILYQEGLKSLESGTAIDCTPGPGRDPETWGRARALQTKMLGSYPRIQERIMEVLHITAPSLDTAGGHSEDQPPSYDEVMRQSSHDSVGSTRTNNNSQYSVPRSINYSDDDYDMLDNYLSELESGAAIDPSADILVEVPVQIFFVSSGGAVSAPSSVCGLRVVRFRQPTVDGVHAFLSVGDWMYPFVPGCSPVLRSADGTYMVPDLSGGDPGAAVGLVVNCSRSQVDKLEQVFSEFSVYKKEGVVSPAARLPAERVPTPPHRPTPPRRPAPQQDGTVAPGGKPGPGITSQDVQKAITKGAEWMSWAVVTGSKYVDRGLRAGSTRLRTYLEPEVGKVDVNPKYEKGVYYARQASGVAVKVSKTLVCCLADMTYRLGKELAPHVKHHGKKLLPDSMSNKEDQIDSVLNVAATGLEGFGKVYLALETAAKFIAKSVADETVDTVTHKYGDAAGRVTEHSLYTVGNIGLTAYNVDNLTLKAIARRAATDTGKAVINSGPVPSETGTTSHPSERPTAPPSQQTPSTGQVVKQ